MPRRSSLADVPWPASKRQINLASDRLRDWWLDLSLPSTLIETDTELHAAVDLVVAFRNGFQSPLNKVTMGVRSMISSEGAPVVVSQRLKRTVTTVRKLARFSGMNLARMQDIGGCRAIVPTREEVEGVVRRIRHNWDLKGFDDYTESPKDTGYRAVHVIVERQGRLIEIQLRTPLQQRWAQEVDRVGGRIGAFLKDGVGPLELLRYFERVAYVVGLREKGLPADEEAVAEIEALEPQVAAYFG